MQPSVREPDVLGGVWQLRTNPTTDKGTCDTLADQSTFGGAHHQRAFGGAHQQRAFRCPDLCPRE